MNITEKQVISLSVLFVFISAILMFNLEVTKKQEYVSNEKIWSEKLNTLEVRTKLK